MGPVPLCCVCDNSWVSRLDRVDGMVIDVGQPLIRCCDAVLTVPMERRHHGVTSQVVCTLLSASTHPQFVLGVPTCDTMGLNRLSQGK